MRVFPQGCPAIALAIFVFLAPGFSANAKIIGTISYSPIYNQHGYVYMGDALMISLLNDYQHTISSIVWEQELVSCGLGYAVLPNVMATDVSVQTMRSGVINFRITITYIGLAPTVIEKSVEIKPADNFSIVAYDHDPIEFGPVPFALTLVEMQLKNNYPSGPVDASGAPYLRVREKIFYTVPAIPPLNNGDWAGEPGWLFGNSTGKMFDYKQVGAEYIVGKNIGDVILEYTQEMGVEHLDVCGNTVVSSIGTMHFKATWTELTKYQIEIVR